MMRKILYLLIASLLLLTGCSTTQSTEAPSTPPESIPVQETDSEGKPVPNGNFLPILTPDKMIWDDGKGTTLEFTSEDIYYQQVWKEVSESWNETYVRYRNSIPLVQYIAYTEPYEYPLLEFHYEPERAYQWALGFVISGRIYTFFAEGENAAISENRDISTLGTTIVPEFKYTDTLRALIQNGSQEN